ncbi:UNVERIFIED_CONTAM: Nuclear pore complex protein [Sesamum calycinum]|uniref:Nuclear pore complex protein n=1 Tax=Sesamum calycinum TaxID=2727403 RepID=A0AAW2NTJ5_9LAMI
MVGLSQLLLRSHSANGLIEDYAACLELRSEECQIIEDSSVDPGVLIMQVSFLVLMLFPALNRLRKYQFLLCTTLKWARVHAPQWRASDGRGGDEGSEDGAAQGSERRCRTRVLGGKSSSLSAGAEPGF